MEHFLAQNIKFLRKKKAVSQTQLGLEVNKKHTAIGNWETGFSEPSYEDFITIARYFGISLDDFLLKNLSEEEIIMQNVLREGANNAYGNNWKEKYYEVLEKYNDCLESKQQSA